MSKKTIMLIILTLVLFIVLIFVGSLAYNIFQKHYYSNLSAKSLFEFSANNQETIFSVDKITYFSSSNAKIETNPNSSFKISNLYQYTDIAIFLESSHSDKSDGSDATENLTYKNTLKSVTISDIKYVLSPTIGTANLYYKNINDFASSSFDKKNIIKDTITFNTTAEDKIAIVPIPLLCAM